MRFLRPETVSRLYRTSIASAFKMDCESFLEEFEKYETFNYTQFANIWQKMNFTCIFADQGNIHTLAFLCDAAFTVVKKYILYQKSLYIKIAAFYLLYGLYYKQPIKGLIRIRMTLEEFRVTKELMNEMVKQKQLEPVYIFAKMKADSAFTYVVKPKPLAFQINPIYSASDINDTFHVKETESSLIKFNKILEDDTVVKLEETCSKYEQALKQFSGKHQKITNFKSGIMEALRSTHQKTFNEVPAEEQEQEELHTIQNIKKKALRNTNAKYRASKNVVTAIDLESDEDF